MRFRRLLLARSLARAQGSCRAHRRVPDLDSRPHRLHLFTLNCAVGEIGGECTSCHCLTPLRRRLFRESREHRAYVHLIPQSTPAHTARDRTQWKCTHPCAPIPSSCRPPSRACAGSVRLLSTPCLSCCTAHRRCKPCASTSEIAACLTAGDTASHSSASASTNSTRAPPASLSASESEASPCKTICDTQVTNLVTCVGARASVRAYAHAHGEKTPVHAVDEFLTHLPRHLARVTRAPTLDAALAQQQNSQQRRRRALQVVAHCLHGALGLRPTVLKHW